MNLTMQKLNCHSSLYAWAEDLVKQSFPLCERRDDDVQRQTLAHPDYHFCALLDGQDAVGVVGFWQTGDFLYLENFCTLPSLRNKGYGSAALTLLKSRGVPVVLEIEIPCDELTSRRKGFYLRNGMRENPYPHLQPRYRKTDAPLSLQVLTYPQAFTEGQYALFRQYLDDNVDVVTRKV